MERGKIAIITPEGELYCSTEFNGDMGYDGNGQEAYERLDSIDHVEEYEDFVQEFNDEYYRYDKVETYKCDDSYLDMQNDYFNKWFSDYVYVKNLSEKSVIFMTADNKKICINADVTAIFYFGNFVACYAEDFETHAFIDVLNNKKENLSYDMTENYSDIWNLCSEYDYNHLGSSLTDRIQEHEFVDEESLEYLVKENATDISRLRCFIGDTYESEIYMLNGYGNLTNVEREDFEGLIDDIIYDLEHKITVPIVKQEQACL